MATIMSATIHFAIFLFAVLFILFVGLCAVLIIISLVKSVVDGIEDGIAERKQKQNKDDKGGKGHGNR